MGYRLMCWQRTKVCMCGISSRIVLFKRWRTRLICTQPNFPAVAELKKKILEEQQTRKICQRHRLYSNSRNIQWYSVQRKSTPSELGKLGSEGSGKKKNKKEKKKRHTQYKTCPLRWIHQDLVIGVAITWI